ncbi:MAG: undecaprenyl-diphosphate phosphatase [Bacilli bacterium]|nr:undecaprenyl-diphosphate phosphatase [Bacilli bacterium]
MINLITYIFLGLLQGITEPIPVSSSGHILILQTILKNLNQSINVDFETLAVITNFGSLIAIVIIYWNDIVKLIKDFFSYIFTKETRKDTKKGYLYSWKLVVATIPAGIFGIIATKIDLLETLEKNIKFIGITLIITSIFLFLIRNFKGKKSKDQISFKDSIIIGLYQMVSVIPGISRSGATIVGGMFQGLKREEAFNFSFLLYIPISIATTILGVKDLIEISISSTTWILYIISAIIAGIFTYIFTKWFAKIVKEGKLIYFSIYCLIIGLLVIILL